LTHSTISIARPAVGRAVGKLAVCSTDASKSSPKACPFHKKRQQAGPRKVSTAFTHVFQHDRFIRAESAAANSSCRGNTGRYSSSSRWNGRSGKRNNKDRTLVRAHERKSFPERAQRNRNQNEHHQGT